MQKIIIKVEDGVDLMEALLKVRSVINSGKISKDKSIPHYCWLTKFDDGLTVITGKKKSDGSADSFTVY